MDATDMKPGPHCTECPARAGRDGLCVVCRRRLRRAAARGDIPGPRREPHGRLGDAAQSERLPGLRVRPGTARALREAARIGGLSLCEQARAILDAWARTAP